MSDDRPYSREGRDDGPPRAGGKDGRDHHPKSFALWLAGGGIKPGVTVGESDELGFNVAKDKVDVHDLHATVLACLGLDHRKLTYLYNGRDERATINSGKVLHDLLL